jgi:CubicO group peptidase (beta-lactamase class C family)
VSDAASAAVGAHVARAAERAHAPGVAWGVMLEGRLALSGGTGTLTIGRTEAPAATSVFRIASMTKSFTAAAVLWLRDCGQLRLDLPIADLVPELASVRPPTTDSPRVTVRHLLSMASGLGADDAWGDRHLDMTPADLDASVAAGTGFALAPGTAYEYSNLGYALLGRIVERTTGAPLQTLVNERFLGPLGMAATTWDEPAGAARPYRWLDGRWHDELPPLGDGAFEPMGGLWSTVDDLTRWMAFFAGAFPPRDDPDGGPLSRASRREQQQLQRASPSELHPAKGDGLDAVPSRLDAGGYGFGLAVVHDLRFGHIVGHGGGLPGYGSHMRWLPGQGVGAVALANVTYAPMGALTRTILEVLDDHGLVPRAAAPSTDTLRPAAERLVDLLNAWDCAAAGALFADNVLLDLDEEHRRAEATRLRAEHGALRLRSVTAVTARRGRLAVAGDDGDEIHLELELSPHAVPLVQFYEVVPEIR